MKKINQILIGTNNSGKFRELSYLLPKRLKKFSPKYFKIKSPIETGKSFFENSQLKAKYFFKFSKMTTISDDSGLSIECLDEMPGIYSARWAKKYGSFKNAMKKIIKMVEYKNRKRRIKNTKATFVCCITIKDLKGKCISAVGKVKGNISNKILGKNGFGYDPIFIPKKYKITYGQMIKKKKMLIDHRYVAYQKIKKRTKIL